jgi:hypothetical protein
MTKNIVAVLALVPAVLSAQAGGATTSARNVASLRSGRTMSVDGEIIAARRRGLPDEPIRRRVSEGRANGATESQLIVAAHRMRVTMESAVEAMAAGGRSRPSDAEIEKCAGAMDQGFTRSQVEAVTRAAPSDRSLGVAFDVLTKLSARGLPVSRALEQVTTKLQARQSDEQIQSLLVVKTGLVVRKP